MTESELYSKVGDLSRRLASIERKVDFLLKELKLQYVEPPEPAYMVQVRALVAQHKIIDAIRVYREQTGVSLADAKEFIEHL